MKLDWAMLADAAEVREGLAFVLGGGIDTVGAAQLPAILNATLLVRLLLHRTETMRSHSIEIRIADEDGKDLAQVRGEFIAADNADVPIGWDIANMFALNIQGLHLQRFGRYSVEILGDGSHLKTLNLRVKPPDQPPAQP